MERDVPAQPQVAQRETAQGSSWFLLLVVFLAGIGTLGIEMVASRLLAPYFGTSQPIWAVVIGLTLIYPDDRLPARRHAGRSAAR